MLPSRSETRPADWATISLTGSAFLDRLLGRASIAPGWTGSNSNRLPQIHQGTAGQAPAVAGAAEAVLGSTGERRAHDDGSLGMGRKHLPNLSSHLGVDRLPRVHDQRPGLRVVERCGSEA